jgi:hypothetical protein
MSSCCSKHHRRHSRCLRKRKKRAKHTFVAGANCCSSHENIFSKKHCH